MKTNQKFDNVNFSRDVASFDIVEATLQLMKPEHKDKLLRSAIANALQRTVRSNREHEVQLRDLFHKSKSYMDTEDSLIFGEIVYENYKIDARTPRGRGSYARRRVMDFVTK